MSLYDDMDLGSLVQFRDNFMADFQKVKTGLDTEGKINLANVEAELKLISKAIVKVKANTPTSNDSANHVVDKNLEKDIRDKVSAIPLFTAGSDVAVFLHECTAIFKTLVEGNSDERVEKEFVRKCKLRLDSTYLTVLYQHSSSVTTFKEFTDYMNGQFQSEMSQFQHMDSISALPASARPDEDITDFSARSKIEVWRAVTIIKNKWARNVLAKKPTATEKEKEMTLDDFLHVFHGQVVLEVIKRNETVYNHIINSLDSTWTGDELANKAKSFAKKLAKETPSPPATVLHVKNKKEQKKICTNFLKGKCTWGRRCYKRHDEQLKEELALQSTDKPDPKPSEGRPRGNNGGKKQSGRQQSKGSTNPGNEDTRGDFTSHHTQLDPSNVMVFPNGPGQ